FKRNLVQPCAAAVVVPRRVHMGTCVGRSRNHARIYGLTPADARARVKVERRVTRPVGMARDQLAGNIKKLGLAACTHSVVLMFHSSGKRTMSSAFFRYAAPLVPPLPRLKPMM